MGGTIRSDIARNRGGRCSYIKKLRTSNCSYGIALQRLPHHTGTVDVPLIRAKISVMGRDRTLHTYDLADYNVK